MEYLHVVVDDKSRPKINEKEAGLAHLKNTFNFYRAYWNVFLY